MRIAFIGGGYMGEALAGAALGGGVASAAEISVSDVASARRELLAAQYGVGVTDDNAKAAEGAGLVVLAVKPQEFSNVAAGLRGRLDADQTVLSIMAGVPIRRIAEKLDHGAIVRVMPNTAAFVGEAISVWTASPGVSKAGRAAAERLLRSAGREVYTDDERYLDMATAVSGSGPGFIFLFLDALIDGAVRIGLPREMAVELAVQTLVGAGTLARELDRPAGELRAMVTSKGGTTAAGLQVLEDAKLREAVVRAVEAAYARAKELSG